MSQSSEENIKFIAFPKYECPKHGNIGNTSMRVQIYATENNPEINRRYCMNCMVEKYDEIGIEQLTEIKEK